jgi:pimeloyl-ACP methyl ester carboxylesterase
VRGLAIAWKQPIIGAKSRSVSIPNKKIQARQVSPAHNRGGRASVGGARRGTAAPPTIPGRWLLTALGLTLVAALFCAWATLCLLFWQGSWQLLYHPAGVVARTPASLGIPFDALRFAATDTGELRLNGWWIPAAGGARFSRYTVLYLHGQNGNMGTAVDALARLHSTGVNVLAFDYRGYGQSEFARPSEERWRQDAEWALEYLRGTRQVAPGAIIVDGEELGANLALEVAAAHPELGGVILESPLADPMQPIFSDPRAALVPARLLARDRYGLEAPAARLRIPSLWMYDSAGPEGSGKETAAYQKVTARKTLVWLPRSPDAERVYQDALARWLETLGQRG